MEYRNLGKTGVKVSVIGFGGIPIQRVDSSTARQILNRALDQGINFIDTARGYTDSEDKIGLVLRERRDECVIATKSMARTAEAMERDIELSCRNLQTDYIDLYQLHNIKDEATIKKVMAPDGALAALKKARQAGKIRYIGITSHRPGALIQAIKTGEFDTVQFPFNPVEREAEQTLLAVAREWRVGTIVMKPLAGGAFRNSQLALRWVLNQPITTAIPGMDSTEQVEMNAGVGDKPEPLTEEETQRLANETKEMGERFCRRCEYCLPCPASIDIPTMFLLDGYYTRYGLQTWARTRYRGLPAGIGDCLDCGECEEKCPYQLPIREMLQRARANLE
ncbi:MAG: aldo/keto reductase [Firmicutes bacterium]|nr:aldo/keto reductase [Bacillota bacterium]